MDHSISENSNAPVEKLTKQLDHAVERLSQTSSFAKYERAGELFDLVRRLLSRPDGFPILYDRISRIEEAGMFTGSDWAQPEILQPAIGAFSLRQGNHHEVILESLNLIRMLAVANGHYFHLGISAEQARHYLTQVLALNLSMVFESPSEAVRERLGNLFDSVRNLMLEIADDVGYESVLDQLIGEIWRIMAQRPIMVDSVKAMVTQVAISQQNPDIDLGASGRGGERLVSALFSPTNGCRDDPGLEAYRERLAAMDMNGLQQEASGLARAMHDTGLVSDYHAVFVRFIRTRHDSLLSDTLGLSETGRDSLMCYRDLVLRLIEEAIYPQTAQSIYGLAMLLERGLLHLPALPPALWRQINLALCPEAEQSLLIAFGDALPARVRLLAGVLSVLGQPLGVGQGNNPTCQAARAISIWASDDPDYLLQLIAWAARDGEVVMQFENETISSKTLLSYYATKSPLDVDPASVVLVPHLDRIYLEMGRLCAGRGEDPHRWINPEFHGWRTGRGFAIAIDINSGRLLDYEYFLRAFYAYYHPIFNGGQPVIHPQPAGLAMTDSAGRFVGWHAITILRAALDQEGVMRVYFYNPNNDSGQDLGQDIVVSTEGHGEIYGESSLPFAEFASRLYIFHFDPAERGDPAAIDTEEISKAKELGENSWAAEKIPTDIAAMA